MRRLTKWDWLLFVAAGVPCTAAIVYVVYLFVVQIQTVKLKYVVQGSVLGLVQGSVLGLGIMFALWCYIRLIQWLAKKAGRQP